MNDRTLRTTLSRVKRLDSVVKELLDDGETEAAERILAECSEEVKLFTFRISDDSQDRMNDTIAVDGWNLENFKANPVVLWGHLQDIPPVGKAVSVYSKNGALKAHVEFHEHTELAREVKALVEGGFLNAVSVGFRPKEWEYREDGGVDFKSQELLEFSVVTVPALPSALLEPTMKALVQQADPLDVFSADALRSALERATPPNAPEAPPVVVKSFEDTFREAAQEIAQEIRRKRGLLD